MKLVRLLTFLLIFACSSCSGGTISRSTLERVHPTTLSLSINGHEGCSATAIGPHAILTAEHCITDLKTFKINGKPVQILRIDRDGDDHVILVVDQRFSVWAHFRRHMADVGDGVFIFGNPGFLRDILREGIVVGYTVFPKVANGLKLVDRDVTVYDFNGFNGDSGSAIFNTDGEIIAVVSFGLVQKDGDTNFKLVGSLPLLFTWAVIDHDTK